MNPTPIHDDDPTPDAVQGQDAAATDELRLMAELAIIHGGRHYFYDGYSYERLADAIAYAQLVRGQAHRHGPSSPIQFEAVGPLTASDRQLMLELSISFENGRFVFERFHYDRLADAASYARDHRPNGPRQ